MLSKSKLPKIETKNIPTASEARSIYKICSSYLDYLIEKGVVPLAERYDYLVERQGEVLEALFKQLYETEMYKGIRISTLNAFWHFCEFVIHEDPIRGKKVWNPFVKNLFSDIEMHRYCCLMASRGIGKSYLAHGLYILFKGFLYKYTDFLLITNIPSQYEENIRTLKRLIESNEMLLQKKKEDCVWTQSKVEYNGGMIIAQSVGTPPRGKHPQYIFPDDILRDDNKISEEELDNFVKAQLLPCAQRWKSRIAFTGTPMHITDIYHDLMNKEKDFKGQIITDGHLSHCGFYSKTYPIITDWDKKEIFLPDLFTWKELVTNVNSIKNIQGDDKFSREYLLVCTDKSTSLFSQELLTRAQDDSIEVTYKDDHDGNYITGVDVATSGEASADFSAFVTIELVETKKGLKKYLRHMVYEKGMPITGDMTKEGEIIDIGQVETIDDIYHRFNTGLVVVEKNNVGVAHIQELQKRNVNVQEFVTDRHKKENMLRYLVSEMKQGNLIFPKDTLEIKALKQELLNFGVKRTRSGKERMEALHGHDDGVMALAIANYASQSYGGLAYAICQD